MNYIVYKTTNLINNKIYIGVHKQIKNTFDGYLGSGKWFRRSLKYHGRQHFFRETLFSYSNSSEAYSKEKYLVDKDFIGRLDTYNIKLGGRGGWDHVHNIECITKANETRTKKYGNPMGMCHTQKAKEKQFATKLLKYGNKMGPCMSKESQIKSKNTLIKLYGDPMGRANFDGAKEKARLTRDSSALHKITELNLPCKLLNPFNEIIVDGSVFDVCKYMYDQRNAIKERYNIIHRLNKGGKFQKGKWKDYVVIS